MQDAPSPSNHKFWEHLLIGFAHRTAKVMFFLWGGSSSCRVARNAAAGVQGIVQWLWQGRQGSICPSQGQPNQQLAGLAPPKPPGQAPSPKPPPRQQRPSFPLASFPFSSIPQTLSTATQSPPLLFLSSQRPSPNPPADLVSSPSSAPTFITVKPNRQSSLCCEDNTCTGQAVSSSPSSAPTQSALNPGLASPRLSNSTRLSLSLRVYWA